MQGLRVAVKDIYDLKGLKTGCGNRAYWDTYDVPGETALSIQRIVDLVSPR
jgi:Asp-tRNA(Asn)/Glu-tRNA(Gln) amidotransferase A subunit family amidase